MHPLFTLTPDLFSGQVLAFFERREVAVILTTPAIRSHFRMDESFCPTHGTRLSKESDSSAMTCIDCIMQERGIRRCDKCDEFVDAHHLFCGECGKRHCESCDAGGICALCDNMFHFNCDACGLFAICTRCYEMYCGNCKKMKTCNCCNRTECL